MMSQTAVDGVTVARGAIGNPWIFLQAQALAAGKPLPPPPSLFAQREVIRDHYRLAEQLYEPRRCGQLMRKFGIKYAALHPEHEKVRADFGKSSSRTTWDEVISKWYSEDTPGKYPDPAIHRSQSEGGKAA